MPNNNQQHTTGLKRTLAKIGGCFSMLVGMYTMVREVVKPTPHLGGVNFFLGGVLIALGKSYLDSGRDATTLKKVLDQSEGQNTTNSPQQITAQPTAPQTETGTAYRNDFAAREAGRAGSRAGQDAGRVAG